MTTETGTPEMTDEVWRVRSALWLLPLGALLLIPAMLVRGRLYDPGTSPLAFAAWAESSGFVTGMALSIAAIVLILFGFLALMAHTSRGWGDGPGLAGFALLIVSVATFLPYVGAITMAGPTFAAQYLAGNAFALAPLTSNLMVGASIASGILYIAASALFALAVWRSGDLPRWTAAVLVIQAPLLAFAGTASFPAEVLGAVLLLAAGVGVAAEVAFEHRVVTMPPATKPRTGAA